jgi:hypothetical protein
MTGASETWPGAQASCRIITSLLGARENAPAPRHGKLRSLGRSVRSPRPKPAGPFAGRVIEDALARSWFRVWFISYSRSRPTMASRSEKTSPWPTRGRVAFPCRSGRRASPNRCNYRVLRGTRSEPAAARELLIPAASPSSAHAPR